MRLTLIVLLVTLAAPASAQCYADYKAKQDNPLRLAYGVSEVPDSACNAKSAKKELAPRLKAGGWKLLDVMGVFGPEGLGERKDRAGEFFLRY